MPENVVGETDELEMAEENPSIETISQLSDAEIGDLLGHDKEIEEIREGIKMLDTLKGKAREYAQKRIEDMFSPKIYVGELKYLAEDAKRQARRDSKEAALDDDSPTSVI